MHATPHQDRLADVYSSREIATAAGADRAEVRRLISTWYGGGFRGYLAGRDAVELVRRLRAGTAPTLADRAPLTLPAPPARKGAAGLMVSGFVHGLALAALLLAASLGLLNSDDTEELVVKPLQARLVFLASPGPGGGGGGGGLRMPTPPRPAERKAEVKLVKRVASAVPPVRRIPAPPRRFERRPPPPRLEPPRRVVMSRTETPPPPIPPPAAVQAPVAPVPADANDRTGLPVEPQKTAVESNGSGTGGGVGSGAGVGLGEGTGGGIGPGSGGGTGGGTYRPGSGIEPPQLIREVRATYTDEARRRAVEGDVVLEIVVRRDGLVGDVRMVRALGAGLDQRAVDAVRQWRFTPAKRQGAPVDVVVEVSVAFKLR